MEDSLQEIRSLWEVPTIAHFCSLFREAFKLSDFDIEDLEDALLIDGTEYGTILIQQLVINLLKGCLHKNGIDEDNYNDHLMNYIVKKHALEGKQLEFPANTEFKHMPVRTKVEILHSLCNYRLDGYDVNDLLKNLESDSLRVEPLGKDESGATYWYFYGIRLYKEVPRNKVVELQKKQKKKAKKMADSLNDKSNSHRHHRKIKKVKKFTYSSESGSDGDAENLGPITGWSIICSTEEDWHELAKKFKSSKSRTEKELYDSISKDFLPEIGRIAQEKQKNFKRRLMEIAPRRVSRRIEVKKQEQDFDVDGTKKSIDKNSILGGRRSQEDTESIYTKKSREERALDRIKATNARAKRAVQRNKMLLRDGASIADDGYELTQEQLYAGMYKVIEAMKEHPNSWPFLRPVQEEMVPGYYKVIKKPMDISVIERKLDSKKYLTRLDFEADVMLMLNNCREFNGHKNRFTRMAESLGKVYKDTIDDVFVLENDADDIYEPSPTKRPIRSKAAASLQKTLSAVHKNTAFLGMNERALAPRSPEKVSTSMRKSISPCHTTSSMDITATPLQKKPTMLGFLPRRINPMAPLSMTLPGDAPLPGSSVDLKYTVPSIDEFALSSPTLGDSKLGISPLMKKLPTEQKNAVQLSAAGFHRLPVNIGTSVRSKLAQAKPMQLNLNAASLSQFSSEILPNGTRTLILKPGAYLINNQTCSIVRTDASSSSNEGKAVVVVCAPKNQGPNVLPTVGNLHAAPTVAKRAYSSSSDAEKISTASKSCNAKIDDIGTISNKRFAVAPPTIQIRNGSPHSLSQLAKENGAPFSKSVRVPVILRTPSGQILRVASPVHSTQGKVPQTHQVS